MFEALMSFAGDATGSDPTNPFIQYGALGILAALGLYFVRREAARADRAENELRELNTIVRDRLAASLADAAHALTDAAQVMAALRDRDHERDRS